MKPVNYQFQGRLLSYMNYSDDPNYFTIATPSPARNQKVRMYNTWIGKVGEGVNVADTHTEAEILFAYNKARVKNISN